MKKLKVHIVDDHQVIADGLQLMLGNHPDIEVSGVDHTGEMALARLVNTVPDVVLMDYSLSRPDTEALNGLETAERILAEYSSVKIMMLTMHDAPNVIVPCVAAGVHGYMLKSERNSNVASAILALGRQGFYFSPSIAKDLAANMRKHSQDNGAVTEREREVLECLFKGGSTRDIADELFISIHTVDTHRRNLIQKLEAKNSIHLIYIALKKGILKV